MSYPILLGEGSYGKVYQISPTKVEKITKWFENGEYNSRNIHEVMFLKSLQAPFIPFIDAHKVEGRDIHITQNYCGITLDKYGKMLSHEEKEKELPRLMIQMARILVWLKQHKVAHFDIKPENLCIDKNGNLSLTLIDFGLVGPVCENSSMYFGTQPYGDPSYFKGTKRLRYEYDMMGMGLSLVSFMTNTWISDKLWIYGSGSKVHIKNVLSKEIKKANISNDEIRDLITAMTDLDETNRITPVQLYNEPLLEKYKVDYPLIVDDPFEEYKSRTITKDISSELKAYSKVLKHKFMFGYISKFATQVVNSGYTKYSVNDIIQFAHGYCLVIFDEFISRSKINPVNFITCLEDLDWKVYPKYGMVDWNMPIRVSEKQYEEWVEKCCVPEFVLLPEYAKIDAFEEIFGPIQFQMKDIYSVIIEPQLFDNETIQANTSKAKKHAKEHIKDVQKWYKKYGNTNKLKGGSKIISVDIVKNRLLLTFDKQPARINDFVDPDKDGNYPIKINKKNMLITSKII